MSVGEVKELNFAVQLMHVSGKPTVDGAGTPITLSSQLSDALCSHRGPGYGKFMGWAIQLANNEPLKLDSTDLAALRNFVEGSEMPALLKFRMIEVIDGK